MLKENQHMVEDYFRAHEIPVHARFIRGGLSVHLMPCKTPIFRFIQNAERGCVEVMWYSHRDKWDHIGDFGGMVMPQEEVLEYVVSDAPGFFGIDFLILKTSRI